MTSAEDSVGIFASCENEPKDCPPPALPEGVEAVARGWFALADQMMTGSGSVLAHVPICQTELDAVRALAAPHLHNRKGDLPTEREVRLVLAARAVAFGDHFSPAAIKELDAASEAYAADVPWDDEQGGASAGEINWKAEWEAACALRIRLANAARPFAELADEFSACGDGQPIGVKAASGKSDLNVGHLRRLSRALAAPDTTSPASSPLDILVDDAFEKMKPFCKACQAIPTHGYCNMKGCPMPRPQQPADGRLTAETDVNHQDSGGPAEQEGEK